MRNRAGTPSPVSGPDLPLAQALALGDVLEPDGLERLVRARTVESIAADTAPGRPPWAGAVLVRYASGTGTDTLTFAVTREDGAAPAPTVIVEGDSLALNRGAIESIAGLVADIAHPGAARAGFAAPELPSIEASDAEAAEGEALEFRLELSQASETPVSVDYETADGTAQEGAD